MIRFGKKLSVFTAVFLAAGMSLSACSNINKNSVPTLTETEGTTVSLTKMTTTTTLPEIMTTTTTAETTTTTTAETTTEETTTTTVSETESETTTTPETTTVATTTYAETTAETTTAATASRGWTETLLNKVMVTNQACYSRAEAIIGADTVAEFPKGMQVTVVAITNTGYYKLADGTFIHSDYLSEAGTVATTTATPRPAQTTAVTEALKPPAANVAVEANVHYTDRYFWNQLTSDEQTLYADIVSAAENFSTSRIRTNGMNYNQIQKIYFLVFNMEPQLFWLDTGAAVNNTGIGLRYIATPDEAAVMQREIDATTKKVMQQASQYSSTFNKLLVFYNYIILNNDFLLTGTAATCGIENGLRPGTEGIQCNGYAKTMQYLCDVAGIECLVLPGKNSHGDTHAWNKVKLNGEWYNLDATWGDPEDKGGAYISYPFFLMPDKWMTASHLEENTKELNSGYVLDFFNTPSCTASDLNYYRVMNREFTGVEAGFAGICADIKRALNAGEQTAAVRITDAASYDTLITTEYWKAAQKYATSLDPDLKLALQKIDRAGTQVVQYNFKY